MLTTDTFVKSRRIFIFSFLFPCVADQIGLTPEEVISKIMANPEVAMAFQNPKVQAAIMDVSHNWRFCLKKIKWSA